MKKFKGLLTLITVLLCAVIAFGVTACADGGISIKLKQDSVTIEVDSGTLIGATIEGTDVAATWEIEDPEIASITVIGKSCSVKGLKVGTTKLVASVGDVKAECEIIVIDKKPVEEVTIKLNGEAITETSLDKGESKTLTAEASLGSDITAWKSSNEKVVTVENGVITGVEYGIATVTAQVTASIKAEVEVTVMPASSGDPDDPDNNFYFLKFAEEDGAKIEVLGDASEQAGPDEYFYWGGKFVEFGYAFQEVTVEHAYYNNGEVDIKYTCDTEEGRWSGFQLFYKNSAHTLYNYYKLDCKINVDVDCRVTLNGNVIDLKAGDNNVSVYYQYTSGSFAGEKYGISSFDLTMGYDDGTQNGVFVQNAEIKISDVNWTDDTATRVKLAAPTFTYNAETGIITINDSNTAGVSGYGLNLYSGNTAVGNVTVKSGDKVDLSAIENGTYTAKIYAIADNAHYINSDDSADSVEITVNNEGGATYDLQNNNNYSCVEHPGRWTYWSESWVEWTTKEYRGGVVTLTFANNTGNWYDTQIFYKNPSDENGKYYKLTATISAPNEGRVTVNGTVITLKEGSHEYTFSYLAGNTASIQITFGVNGESNKQEITAGTVTISNVSVEEVTPEKLQAPSFTYNADTKVITITDPNESGVTGYRLNLYDNDTLAGYIPVENGKAVDLEKSTAKNGEYTAKLIAVGDGTVNLNSDPSENSVTITIANEKINIANGEEGGAISNPGEWIEWHDQNWCGSNVTVSEAYIDKDGAVHITYSGMTVACTFGTQLFWYDATLEVGNVYVLNMKINASAAGVITICGTEVTLKAGDNDISVPLSPAAGKASISIQFGSNVTGGAVIAAGTFVLSEIEINSAATTKLQAPSFTYNEQTGIITITDPNEEGVGSYKLNLYVDEALAATVTVVNGQKVNLDTVSNGTYTAKLVAVGATALYTDSDESTNSIEVTVANTTTLVEFGDQPTAEKSKETWFYWNNQGWVNGAWAEVSACYLDEDGGLHITFKNTAGSCWHNIQIFKALNEGKATCTFKLKVTSSVAGRITICGNVVELKEGVNEIAVDFAGALISIQLGVAPDYMLPDAELSFEEMTFEAIVAEKLEAPTFTIENNVITITDPNGANVSKHQLLFFIEDTQKGSVVVENGKEIDLSSLDNGEYTVKLVAVGDGVHYTNSDPSTTTATVTVENSGTTAKLTQVENDGADLNDNLDTWCIWAQLVDLSTAEYDRETGDITIAYTYKDANNRPWYAIRLLYRQTAPPKAYIKMTITVEEDCAFRINNVDTELKAGANEIYVATLGTDVQIVFGKLDASSGSPEGTYTITNIEFTNDAPAAE